MLFIVAAFKSL